jgi:hypothetical protein
VARIIESTVLDFQVIVNAVSSGYARREVLGSLACLNGSDAAFQNDMIILNSGVDMKVGVRLEVLLDCR